MSEPKAFPDVDPDQIEAAGRRFHSAASDLGTAQRSVRSVVGTRSWRSPEARPAWDSALIARASDIANADEVLTHVGNVLLTTGTEVARSTGPRPSTPRRCAPTSQRSRRPTTPSMTPSTPWHCALAS